MGTNESVFGGSWLFAFLIIALMFGGGNAFDSIVSGIAYYVFIRKSAKSDF